jgi:Mg2+ and Co2+ transporter CorA
MELDPPSPTSSAKHIPTPAKVRWRQCVSLKTITWLLRFIERQRRRKLSPLMQTLLRMSRVRRRVILLARLLGSKNEIIGHLRKRLVAGELAIRLGDVQGTISIVIITLEGY